jgi:hypothetical protein
MVAADIPSSKGGKTGGEMVAEFSLSVPLSYLKESSTCHKILGHGADSFTDSYRP